MIFYNWQERGNRLSEIIVKFWIYLLPVFITHKLLHHQSI